MRGAVASSSMCRWCCVLLLLFSSLVSPAVRAARDVLQVASCPRQGGEYLATLPGRITLLRAAMAPAISDEENARVAILHQVRYVWGWLRTNPQMQREVQAVLSAEPASVEVKSLRRTRYGRNLALPWTQTPPHLEVTDSYTLRAIQRGFTRVEDEALEVEYVVRFKLALCGVPRDVDSILKVPLPRDPWLLYWHVPQKHHRLMRYYDRTAVTNPCSDDDFADLPHPFYYWYDWQPDRRGPDANGKPFDCRKLMKSGLDYFPHEVALHRIAEPTLDFSDLHRSWRAESETLRGTVLFGVLDQSWPDLELPVLRDELSDGAPLADRVTAALAKDKTRERAARQMLHMLRDLPDVMTVSAHRAAVEGEYLRVEVEGVLRRSARKVALVLQYGFTNVFGPRPPGHWEIARRALSRDHLVIYVGHSGIGENLRLAQIEHNLKLPTGQFSGEVARAPYQLVAFLSCYSYMYFGQDMLDAGAAGRQFIYTGTGYGKGDRGALSVLDVVDQVLVNDGTPVRVRYLEDEDFLLFKSRRRDGGGP
ncbi:MAG: hypothetical protein AB2A00_09055 [Myxococcota bacterium]